MAMFAFLLFWNGVVIHGLVSDLSFRNDGAHTTAVALSTRSETWQDEDGSYTVHFTKVGYTVDGEKYVREISGSFEEGRRLDVLYDRGNPGEVRNPSDVGIGSIIGGVVFLIFGIGMLGFLVSFVRDWRSF
nr:DUF3592 domain-containing protein [Parafrankia sp. EUN1f]